MAALSEDATFWSKISRKYAANPIRDMDGYLETLARTKSYLKPEDNVLELGCGTGSTALLLAPHVAHITGTDLASGMIEIANEKLQNEGLENVRFEVADVSDQGPDGSTYDVVLAHNLLHLVRNLDDALGQINARIKRGGIFISKTVCAPENGGFKYAMIHRVAIPIMQRLGKAPFVRFMPAQELERTMTHAGFEIIEVKEQAGLLPSHYIVARKV